MPEPTASIQLIVFGQRNRDDIAGVLRDVKTAGYPAFEAGDMYESYGEETTRRLLAETGLRVSGAHFGYRDYADAKRLDRHIAYAKAVGLQNLMCSGVADPKTAEGYRQSARVFNEAGKRLKDEGLIFNYHNHAWEFEDLGGVNGMEILSQETDPNLVKFNMDVFWVYYGGQDPVGFIRRHADRAGYFHFKDGRRVTDASGKAQPEFLELGRGDVDLKAAMEAARQVGATWIVAEQDNTKLSPLEAATISRNYMRDVLGV
ncbi:MAG TPA: sugar phosphate isomerase/epimerase [Chthonomonadaceae bacterium]|nr:sugar phosphate isomerase/epimerase [Chthonomonadaceae bacterium]